MDVPEPSRNAPVYVIGDIHGRLDLLERMISAIHSDSGERGGNSLTVTVGDYIDRGPDSRGVIARLMANPFPGRYLALKGNHEAIMLTFLADPQIGSYWAQLGGRETMLSFGVDVLRSWGRPNFEQAAAALRAALTDEEVRFLNSLSCSLSLPQHFICHAGVRPGVPLDRQREEDLLWIREPFLNSEGDFGKCVVHGHTPVFAPEVKANRINVDTGAFIRGRLTCVVLEGGAPRFLTAMGD